MSTVRERLASIVNGPTFQNSILVLIFINGIVLAVDVMPGVADETRRGLQLTDRVIVWIFIVEIALRIFANGRAFLRDGWSIFDFLVVAISAPGTVTGASALRILRAIRLLRVLSGVSHLRRVGEALVAAVPGISWVAVLLFLLNVIGAIIATNLYGEGTPEYFGDLFTSMYTLFIFMTLENWPDIGEVVLEVYPHAWIFFVIFIVVATFTVMNLFVGVIVAVMDRETSEYYEYEKLYRINLRADMDALQANVESLLQKVDGLVGEGRGGSVEPAGERRQTPGGNDGDDDPAERGED
jgi:voltage-gated sodium channel